MSTVRRKALGRPVVSIFLYLIQVDTQPVFIPSLPQTDRVSSPPKSSDLLAASVSILSFKPFSILD